MSQHKELKYRLLFDELMEQAEKELNWDEFCNFLVVIEKFIDVKVDLLCDAL